MLGWCCMLNSCLSWRLDCQGTSQERLGEKRRGNKTKKKKRELEGNDKSEKKTEAPLNIHIYKRKRKVGGQPLRLL